MWSTALARLSACSQSLLGAEVRLAPGMSVPTWGTLDGPASGTEACSAQLSSGFEQRLSLGDDGVIG